MKIALDIDGVLADYGKHLLDYLNIKDKTPPIKWNDSRFIENFDKIKDDKQFWLTIPVLTPPQDIKFDFECYVTARPISSEITALWLKKNGFPDKEVFTIGHNQSKVNILQEQKIEIFLDDAIHNFTEINKTDIICFLFDSTYNKEIRTTLRVYDMDDFLSECVFRKELRKDFKEFKKYLKQ